jgi:hypothetical protein
MKKNLTDEFQKHITDTIKKVRDVEKPKKLMPQYKQDAFRDLCLLQQQNDIAYIIYLKAYCKK